MCGDGTINTGQNARGENEERKKTPKKCVENKQYCPLSGNPGRDALKESKKSKKMASTRHKKSDLFESRKGVVSHQEEKVIPRNNQGPQKLKTKKMLNREPGSWGHKRRYLDDRA